MANADDKQFICGLSFAGRDCNRRHQLRGDCLLPGAAAGGSQLWWGVQWFSLVVLVNPVFHLAGCASHAFAPNQLASPSRGTAGLWQCFFGVLSVGQSVDQPMAHAVLGISGLDRCPLVDSKRPVINLGIALKIRRLSPRSDFWSRRSQAI